MSVTVSTLAELKSALTVAKGGEAILLKAGDYGKFSLSSKDFPSNVTIASADPGNPAVFSGLVLSKVGNLTIDGVIFDYTYKSIDNYWSSPFTVKDSNHVTIRNSVFDGDLAQGTSTVVDGYGTGYGLSVRGGQNIAIENNEFFDFGRGAVFGGVSGLTVSGNDLHHISTDGMNFTQVTDVLVEGNFLHDFARSPSSTAHTDMIQFWTNGTKEPSGDIVIRGNRLDVGDGTWTQSIFMRNEMVDSQGSGKEMFYYNVLIEDNIIVNGHLHGITVGETDGLTIRNNTLVHAGSESGSAIGSIRLPSIRVAQTSTDVVIIDNIAASIAGYGDQHGWRVEGNLILKPQDYDGAFITSTMSSNNGTHDFRPLPGGVVDLMSVGAAETLNGWATDLAASFNAIAVDQSLSTWVFDGTAAWGGVKEFPAGTVFHWDFGDGNAATGRVVTHSYADAGYYQAQLTIRLPDGSTDTAHHTVGAAGYEVLEMRLGTGFVSHDMGVNTELAQAAVTAKGLVIGAPGAATSVGKRHVADLIGSDSFGIDISLKASDGASAGEVFRLHGSMIATVTSKGEFCMQFFTTGGDVKLITSGSGLGDKKSHDIRIDYANDQVSITVDGKLLASAAMPEPLTGGSHDLTFGNPWGKANFAGVITEFAIDRGDLTLPNVSKTAVLDTAWAEKGVVIQAMPEIVGPDVSAPEPAPSSDAGASGDLSVTQPTKLDLGDPGVAHHIVRSSVQGMLENGAFSVTFNLQANSTASKGEVFRLHQSVTTTVNVAGELQVQAFTTKGQVTLVTKGAGLGDLGQHEVGLSLAEGVLSITVDGVVKASLATAGTLQSVGKHHLTFGNPWGKQNFDGVLSDFDLQFSTRDDSGREVWTSVDLEGKAVAATGTTAIATPVLAMASEDPGASALTLADDDVVAGHLSAVYAAADDDGGQAAHILPSLYGAATADVEQLIAMDHFGFLADFGALVPST